MKRIIPLLLMIALLGISCSNGTYTFCTVSFDADGGTEIPQQEIIRGKKAVEPNSPEKDGYIFLCWTLNSEKYDFSTAVEKDITLTAEYTADDTVCTVIFNADGGTEVPQQKIIRGKKAVEPKSPEKDGYTFLYWTLDGVNKYDFNTAVENDITLTAEYTVDDSFCIVSFETDGGTEVLQQEVYKGKKAVEPKSPEKDGYTFLYWVLDGVKYDFSKPVDKSITLKAKYQDNSTIEDFVKEAERIYTIADILVNRTSLINGTKDDISSVFTSKDDAALLLATALNIREDQLYIKDNGNTAVYSSSAYSFEVKSASLATNNTTSDGNTININLENLYLKGMYENKSTMQILWSNTTEVTFDSVDIEWKNDGTEITGTVELKVNDISYSTLTFTSDGTKMTKATYGGTDITSKL